MSAANKRKGSLKDRLLNKRNITDNGCWEFTGYLNNKGYGEIGKGTRAEGLMLAHRASYEVHVGPIPDGMIIMHTCDNPKCFNPEHLQLGTMKDNYDDMVSKKRNVVTYGEAHGNTKLTKKDIEQIKKEYIPAIKRGRGYKSNSTALAEKYGVTRQYIAQILKGDWRKNG